LYWWVSGPPAAARRGGARGGGGQKTRRAGGEGPPQGPGHRVAGQVVKLPEKPRDSDHRVGDEYEEVAGGLEIENGQRNGSRHTQDHNPPRVPTKEGLEPDLSDPCISGGGKREQTKHDQSGRVGKT